MEKTLPAWTVLSLACSGCAPGCRGRFLAFHSTHGRFGIHGEEDSCFFPIRKETTLLSFRVPNQPLLSPRRTWGSGGEVEQGQPHVSTPSVATLGLPLSFPHEREGKGMSFLWGRGPKEHLRWVLFPLLSSSTLHSCWVCAAHPTPLVDAHACSSTTDQHGRQHDRRKVRGGTRKGETWKNTRRVGKRNEGCRRERNPPPPPQPAPDEKGKRDGANHGRDIRRCLVPRLDVRSNEEHDRTRKEKTEKTRGRDERRPSNEDTP